jgi:glycosyltransferase involved in cell wall biosynthesis
VTGGHAGVREASRVRILYVSHACVVAENQKPLAELSRDPAISLALFAPSVWSGDYLKRMRFAPSPGFRGRLFVERPLISGPDYRMHLAVYPGWWRAASAFQPDLIALDEDPFALCSLQFACAARRLGARLLFRSAETGVRVRPPPFKWIERVVFTVSHGAIVRSGGAEKVLRAKGYAKPVFVVPHCVDTEAFSPEDDDTARSELGLAEPVIGYFGRIVQEKGVLDFVDALARLREEGVPATGLLVGSGRAEAAVRERIERHGLSGHTRMVGAVPHGEVSRYYRAADVVVVPSRTTAGWREWFGRVIIEANASGVPVVGSDSGEIPHVIGQTGGGLVFPEGDVGAMVDRLRTLLETPGLRRALGQSGRKAVVREFSIPAQAAKLRNAFLSSMAAMPAGGESSRNDLDQAASR